jgi:hypothetical protein
VELNWPLYGDWDANTAKSGETCYESSMWEAVKLVQHIRNFSSNKALFATVVDSMPGYNFDEKLFTSPLLSFAKLNTLASKWRKGRDISMPPPMIDRPARLKYQEPEILGGKPKTYFLTFKGRFSTSKVREELGKLHDPENGIVIVDSSLKESDQYSYEGVMSDSVYTLIVRGDAEFSYRFSEAVCSGAIPILIADGWVPPFESLVPFEMYGSAFMESDIREMVSVLRKNTADKAKQMQSEALRFCYRHIINVHKQWDTMLSIILSDAIK